MLGSTKRRWLVVAVTIAVAGLAAAAHAAIPDGNGVIHGCIADNGKLSVIDAPVQACKSSERPLDWSQTGPQGPAGPQGTQGPQGPQGPPGPVTGSHAYQYGDSHSIDQNAYRFVAELSLPDGQYVIWARFQIINLHDDEEGFCVLFDGNGVPFPLSELGLFVGDDNGNAFSSLVVPVTSVPGGKATLKCKTSIGQAGAGATLVAMSVDGVTSGWHG